MLQLLNIIGMYLSGRESWWEETLGAKAWVPRDSRGEVTSCDKASLQASPNPPTVADGQEMLLLAFLVAPISDPMEKAR